MSTSHPEGTTVPQPTIQRIELRVLDPDRGVRWTERAHQCRISTTVITIVDSDGVAGVAGADSFTYAGADLATAESVRGMWPALRGRSIDCGAELVDEVRVGVVFPYLTNALSLVDMALWDLRAKHAGQPLWADLGGQRDRIRGYASLESMPQISHYVDIVGQAVADGFTAVKLHAFGDPAKDIELYTHLRQVYPDLTLMHDAECVYDREEALTVGQALSEMDCPWYEAPLHELDLQGYRELRRQIDAPVLPAGYALGDRHQVTDALLDPPWSACRSEIASSQGITGLLALSSIAASHGLNLEPVTYGSAFYAMAGLHTVLATGNAGFHEVAYPMHEWEYGVLNPARPDADGLVHAPDAPGLGLELDNEMIDRLTRASISLGY